jgi:selenocysteine lyase/cysteine desulfurase
MIPINFLTPTHYSRFKVSERLLTGHSHQAWPDVAFEAQQQAWLDAAALVDAKWEKAETVASEVRRGFRRLLQDEDGDIALGVNTHDLIVRWLSAILPMFGSAAVSQATIVTTDGEFHTIRRQLDRLSEEGVIVTRVAARPSDTLAERLAQSIDHATSAVLVSSVLFETAEIVDGLDRVAAACAHYDVPLLVDAYHHLNVVPFDLGGLGLDRAFVVGGGYKYCQLGEGNCFPGSGGLRLRPVLPDGSASSASWRTQTAATCDSAWRGTVCGAFDPTSHYRAAGLRLPRRNGADARSPARDEPAASRAPHRSIRGTRHRSGGNTSSVPPNRPRVRRDPIPRAADLVTALRARLWADHAASCCGLDRRRT